MKLFLDANKYIDTNQPLDLSIPLQGNEDNLTAWYVDAPKFEPVVGDDFIGLVEKGGAVNFRNIFFNPHGHGTHTECLGHITPEIYSVNAHLKTYFFTAKVITVTPSILEENGDAIIQLSDLKMALDASKTEALIVRTLPNSNEKQGRKYSSSNPPYFNTECLPFLNELGVKHLLVDLPSVDKENDDGVLAFHHGFWEVPVNPQFDKTITEFIYVADEIKDGSYILNLQTAPFENDAAPSRPVLYRIFA